MQAPTVKQMEYIINEQASNPGMLPITWGYYSNGSINLAIRYKENPLELYTQSVSVDGVYENGSGPWLIPIRD